MAGEPTITEIFSTLLTNYQAKTSTRVKIIDSFIVYVLLVALIIFSYASLVGTFPFNSFLSAFFTAIGLLVLSVSLRKHVNSDTSKDFEDTSPEKAYSGYLLCCIVLFFTATVFMG